MGCWISYLKHVRNWGSISNVKIIYPNQNKLYNILIRCIFVGYLKGYKDYRLFNDLKIVIESNDVEFIEELNSDFEESRENQLEINQLNY